MQIATLDVQYLNKKNSLQISKFHSNLFALSMNNFDFSCCCGKFWPLNKLFSWMKPWTNFSWQDKLWAEFSTLEVAACRAMHLMRSITIRPNLELKTGPKQLLGSLQLDIVLPDESNYSNRNDM